MGLPDFAFIGKAGSGKSTAAELLVQTLDYEVRSFAAPLKRIAAELWGDEFDRGHLQKLGVAVRDIDPDTWADMLVRGLTLNDGPIVVDDCRFPNEYWKLKARGFVVVRITAEEHRRVARLQANGKYTTPEQMNHISETALDDIKPDYVIANDDDKMELFEQLTIVLGKARR